VALRSVLAVLVSAWLSSTVLGAQTTSDPPEPRASSQRTTQPEGFYFGSFLFSGQYFSQSLPPGIRNFPDVFLASSETLAVSADVDWFHQGNGSFAKLQYLPLYGYSRQAKAVSNWNQSLAFTLSRRGRSKWGFTLISGLGIENFDQALFGNTALTVAASSNAPFKDLANATIDGTSPNPALANVGGFQPDRTIQEHAVFGNRAAHVDVQSSAVYHHSARLAISANVGASYVRHLEQDGELTPFVVPEANATSAALDFSYSYPRNLEIGAQATYVRAHSTLIDSESYIGSVHASKTLRRHWFGDGSVGLGFNTGVLVSPRTMHYAGGFGFRGVAHTILATYNRGITDAANAALGSLPSYFTAVGGAWHWQPRLSPWSAGTIFSHFTDAPPGIVAPTSWLLVNTVNRFVGRTMALRFEYATGRTGARRYVQDGVHYQLAQNTYRLSVQWFPRPQPRY
jgi:hypothetical protein